MKKFLYFIMFLIYLFNYAQNHNLDLSEEESNLKGKIDSIEYFSIKEENYNWTKTIIFDQYNREIYRKPKYVDDSYIIKYENIKDSTGGKFIRKKYWKKINDNLDSTKIYKDSIVYIGTGYFIESEYWYENHKKPMFKKYFLRDSLYNIIQMTHLAYLGNEYRIVYSKIYIRDYTSNSILIKTYHYDDPIYVSSSEKTYNSNGDIIEIKENAYAYSNKNPVYLNLKYCYVYDEEGNWLKKGVIKDGVETFYEVRKIYYTP